MSDKIHLQIVTGAGVVLDRMAASVHLPLTDGGITILGNHAPMMGAVADGVVTCDGADGADAVAVGVGVVQVADNEVTVLVRAAGRGEDIDVPRAEAAEHRARTHLEQKAADLDAARAEAALLRAIARQHAAQLVKKKRRY